jgi:hypothetical protein
VGSIPALAIAVLVPSESCPPIAAPAAMPASAAPMIAVVVSSVRPT